MINETLRGKTGQKEVRESSYSKGLLGKIRNSLDHGRLEIVGGGSDGQIAKARHFMDYLPGLSSSSDVKPHELAGLTLDLARAMDLTSLVKDNCVSDERYVQQIGGEDLHNLPAIAMDLVPLVNSERQTVIRVVYGATEEMPFRSLSYVLPALLYMEGFAEAKLKVPQLQVVFANNTSTTLNNLDPEKTEEQSLKFANFAKDYVKEFFPASFGNVVFLEDTPIGEGSMLGEELFSLAKTLKEKMPESILEELSKKGINNDFETSILYGAAHLLIHDIDLPGALIPVFSDQPETYLAENIISMGGFQEQFFYRLRHGIKPFADEKFRQAKTLQFFTRHRVPPYYMARTGDLSLDDVLKGEADFKTLSPATLFDINYMRNVSAYRGDFGHFLRRSK
ncbi:hypothetical protein C4559_01110 [Candidatus Microgenomates bacterium]|nr:MAG: hypothetical protein C4559_01110 [Candidatus Microgenomates bacterium]